jgi:DNA-binding FadR family transcriptional regulator
MIMSDFAIKPVDRPPALHQSVKEAIRSYILENRLPPGSPLPAESELAARLGVSRNSVREAVKVLESFGFLETRRGSGLFVRDFSLEILLDNLPYALISDLNDLREVFQVRQVLEVGLIEQAIQTLTPTQLTDLEQVVERMRQRAEQGEPFPDEDREFHQRLFANANNQVLLKLLDIFWLVFHKAEQQMDLRNRDPLATYRDHAAILAAIKSSDVAAARAALVRHYHGLNGLIERMQAGQRQPDGAVLSSS